MTTAPWKINSIAQYADKFARVGKAWQYLEKRAVPPGELPAGSEWEDLVRGTVR